ncbi:MAG: recombinase family protein [Candidatus Omnitrophica bacterium]|nr:recombinase family protein [Candidatus Omnitrophota bacterium]
MLTVALYGRVSKNDESQNPENQLLPLREFAKTLGGEIVEEYVDCASGGSSGRVNFLRMLDDSAKGKFNLLLMWSLDRFSREGISNTLGYLARLERNGVAIKSLQESWLDTRDVGVGRLLLAIFCWIAEQERRRIRERTLAGLKRAKEAGKTLGRPEGSKDKKRRRKSGYNMRWTQDKQSSPLKTPVSAV